MDRRKFLFLMGSTISTPAFGFSNTNNDIFVPKPYINSFYSLYHKLNKLQNLVGFSNFNLLNLDDAIKLANNYSKIGKFTKKEMELIEYFFYTPADKFGFYGERTVYDLHHKINKKDVIKIPRTGHFVYRGESLKVYKQMIKDVNNIYLTSGVRSVVKQLRLFMRKIKRCNLNITRASFSLAPPGYSYHTISDFDVGKIGWGLKNFTSRFAKTKEFYEIRHLNYVGIRYRRDNHFGVRFEPWHIKVI